MSQGGLNVPPFPQGYRASGVLLHVTSLPTPYGIGDFGPAALTWIDRLSQAGQSWWQFLPLEPAGEGNSPYSSLSSFAGNGLLTSPDRLVEDGFLRKADLDHQSFSANVVDYDAVAAFKQRLFEKAWTNFKAGARADLRASFDQFCSRQSHWLEDYALFQALRNKFDRAPYLQWPAQLVDREPSALDRVRRELSDQISLVSFVQFLFSRQAAQVKAYAHSKGLGLIGDMPFFVASDSSDVWAHPELFLLDERHRPTVVAGVPPDYFSADGQLWGNPEYDWNAIRRTGYRWCIDRLGSLLAHVDVIRLDHFRGFAAAWHVPVGAANARSGQWFPGPGADFFHAVQRGLGAMPFIAEDLGSTTPDVYALRDQFHLPGMRVLQFAFDGHSDNPHLPQNYSTSSVAYTGTHDNPTTRGWFEDLPHDQQENVWKYLRGQGTKSGEVSRALMELAWSSVAALAMAPLQDLLNLGREARMNIPGRPEGNWRWRCMDDMLSDPAFAWLRDLTKDANRSRVLIPPNVNALEAATKN
jgi:4-alpha-glucanotransferase